MPRLPQKKKASQQPPTVAIALMMCILCGGGFFGLLAIVFPGAGMLGLAMLILGSLFVAQYFLWGRWLYRVAVRKEAQLQASIADTEPSERKI